MSINRTIESGRRRSFGGFEMLNTVIAHHPHHPPPHQEKKDSNEDEMELNKLNFISTLDPAKKPESAPEEPKKNNSEGSKVEEKQDSLNALAPPEKLPPMKVSETIGQADMPKTLENVSGKVSKASSKGESDDEMPDLPVFGKVKSRSVVKLSTDNIEEVKSVLSSGDVSLGVTLIKRLRKYNLISSTINHDGNIIVGISPKLEGRITRIN